MSVAKRRSALPAERGCAWILTFLLTVLLTVTVVCVLTVQTMTSAGFHMAVATGDDVVNGQVARIYDKIDEMAEVYGFDAKNVRKAVNTDEIRSFNREVATWWSTLLIQGKMKDAPSWYSSEIEDAVYNATRLKELEETPETIAEDLTAMMETTLFPLRESLMSKGMNIAQEKVDIPSLIRALRRMPMLGLTACLFAAGMIALLLGREFSRSLKYYGTALAGTGFATAAVVVIVAILRPGEILSEASEPLADGFCAVAGRLGLAAGVIIAALLAAGYLCLFLYNRTKGRNEAAGLRK